MLALAWVYPNNADNIIHYSDTSNQSNFPVGSGLIPGWMNRQRCGIGPSSFLGFHSGGKDTKNKGHYSEALGEDSPSHRQLGLFGFPKIEGTEAINQSSSCSQTAWRTQSRNVTEKKILTGHVEFNLKQVQFNEKILNLMSYTIAIQKCLSVHK